MYEPTESFPVVNIPMINNTTDADIKPLYIVE